MRGLLASVGASVLGLVVGEWLGVEVVAGCSSFVLSAAFVVALGWIVRAVLRRLLWGVGRRLLISYVLIGVMPLPFLFGFVWVSAWMMSGQLAARRVEDSWRLALEEVRAAAEEGTGVATVTLPPVPPLPELEVDSDRDVADSNASTPVAEPAPPSLVGADSESVESEDQGVEDRGSDGDGGPEEEAGTDEDPRPAPEKIAEALADRELPSEGFLRAGDLGVVFVRQGDRVAWRVVEPEIRTALEEVTEAGVAFPQAALGGESTSVTIGIQVGEGDQETITAGRLFRDGEGGRGPFDAEIVYWARSAGIPYLRHDEGRTRVRDDPFLFIVRTSIEREARQLFGAGLQDEMNAEIAKVLPVILWTLVGTTLAVYFSVTLVAGVLVLRIVRAASRLDHGFRALEKGDFSRRLPPLRGRDQLAELVAGFNRMAGHLGHALEVRAEQEATQRELQVARDLQSSLLPPRETVLAGLRIAADVEPAAAVGGDFFHLHEEVGGRLVVGVGDVSGHGLPTGIVMAATRALVSALADSGRARGTDAPELMRTLDRELRRMTNRRTFVTLVCCRFDPRRRRVEVTNAGHLPPWRVRRDGGVESVEGSTRPLGVGPPTDYTTFTSEIAPGDRWILISDGFVEAVGPTGELFGFERFEELLASLPPLDAAATRDHLIASWEEWTGRKQPEDDRTVCVVEVPEPASLPVSAEVVE